MDKKLIIAVDGYSSCGKSTFARKIASELEYIFIDSGAMYRAVTLYALRNDLIDNGKIDIEGIISALPYIRIDFRFNTDKKLYETYLNNENVEEDIRGIEVSDYVSPLSQIREVRDKMVHLQREIGVFKGIVMDGRDIGTVVFPDADIKIFMTASPDIRAERRYNELREKGVEINYNDILENVNTRDLADSGRDLSPLRQAEDAYVLDNSNMTVDDQMDWFRNILQKYRDEN
ncbi:MAG: (d)CMP kinase [Marinilabiliaceae bacterium]|jgi:cytidylate kinase|nr:(d)CMP kinase [Marinilabiliaceae bacterium]